MFLQTDFNRSLTLDKMSLCVLFYSRLSGGEGSAAVRPFSHEDGDRGQLSHEWHHQGHPRGPRLIPGGRRPDPGNRGVD